MSMVNPVLGNRKIKSKELIIRILWYFIWYATCFWTPKLFNSWRIFILKLFGAQIGSKTLIFGSVWIDMPWNLAIGDNCAIGKRSWIYNFSKVSIGSNTVISQNTIVCTASHDYEHPNMPFFSKPINIEDQVWVSSDCFILPGITIKAGCVIGARSVVTKDLSSWGVYAGNPAIFIKKRVLKNVDK